jgi:oligopeptide transport system permease protein
MTDKLVTPRGTSPLRLALRQLRHDHGAIASLTTIFFIAALCWLGPLFSPHAYDRVYRDYVRAEPSLEAHPSVPELQSTIEKLGDRMRVEVESAELQGDDVRLVVKSERPIDPRVLRYFEGSDMFGKGRINATTDEGRRMSMTAPVKMQVFPFGTDDNGRDLLVRILVAGRISLAVGALASLVALVIGTGWGAVAGYAGGRIDMLMMRIVDIIYALPFVFFVIVLVVLFGRNFVLIFVAVGAVEWLDMARIVRGQTLSIKRRDYVAAAEAMGVTSSAILRRHIIPNTLGPVIAYLTLLVPRVILVESFVSFLGLGVQEPLTSWGVLIADGARNIQDGIYLLIFPALFLSVTLMALNRLGEGLRQAFDPRGA